jgi:CrcB protein
MTALIVCAAGGVGALARFIADGLIRTRLGRKFPWSTLCINVSGALLLGVVTALALHNGLSASDKLVIGTGFCGGYTTFSTASFETVRLLEEKRVAAAMFHALTNIGLTVGVATVALLLV